MTTQQRLQHRALMHTFDRTRMLALIMLMLMPAAALHAQALSHGHHRRIKDCNKVR